MRKLEFLADSKIAQAKNGLVYNMTREELPKTGEAYILAKSLGVFENSADPLEY